MSKKSISRKLVEAVVDAGVQALAPTKQSKLLSEMPETPLLVLPEAKQVTATAGLMRETMTNKTA